MEHAEHLENVPNHTINPVTGYMESAGFLETFDGIRKEMFIKSMRTNGFSLTKACEETGVSSHTVYLHKREDPVFREALEGIVSEYSDSLEWFSREQAFRPNATLERIFHLRALLPGKYARELRDQERPHITINVGLDALTATKKRDAITLETKDVIRSIDAENLDFSGIPA